MNETIQRLEVSAFKVPTDFPESDGTAKWDSTTLILVELGAGNISGLGYSYSHECCVPLIREKLFPIIVGQASCLSERLEACPTILNIPALWNEMNSAVRNLGRHGIAMSAIAAVEIALWDLKAKILNLPLAKLLGAVREKIPVYGSGGFTSYSDKQLRKQFENWVGEGISMVKMKIGREPGRDESRVKSARKAIGQKTKLFVDANGAYSQKQALALAEKFSEQNVSWFEEPISSDNLNGLRFIRERLPVGMELSAGEYNYDLLQARQMLEAGAVDVLQADATRCGVTGFLQMANLCDAFQIPLSAHTAPALHAHLCCAATRAEHVEYFHDHVRIEQMFFDGATTKHRNGFLQPDLSRAGLGLEFKKKNATKFEIKL
ncbi:MAG: enolase C-terminal domain-like protein [Limisphaerales bacterium]